MFTRHSLLRIPTRHISPMMTAKIRGTSHCNTKLASDIIVQPANAISIRKRKNTRDYVQVIQSACMCLSERNP